MVPARFLRCNVPVFSVLTLLLGSELLSPAYTRGDGGNRRGGCGIKLIPWMGEYLHIMFWNPAVRKICLFSLGRNLKVRVHKVICETVKSD